MMMFQGTRMTSNASIEYILLRKPLLDYQNNYLIIYRYIVDIMLQIM